MTKIVLHGLLGNKFGKEHNMVIHKPIDAIRALMATKRGFRKAFKTWGREGKFYEIICDDQLIETEGQLTSNGSIKEIHISPIIVGSSNALKIIVGAIMVVVGVWSSQGWLISMGMSLILGGVMGILFPPPTPTFESSVQSKSFLFSSVENSTKQGIPVPLGYGRLMVGSKVISTSLKPEKLGDSGGSIARGNGEPSLEDSLIRWGAIQDTRMLQSLNNTVNILLMRNVIYDQYKRG